MTNPATSMSMDGTDPRSWDPKTGQPGRRAANHRLLYEDESIRVLSVSIAPGATENPHHHRWPSVFVINSMPSKMRDFNGKGEEIPLPFQKNSNCRLR